MYWPFLLYSASSFVSNDAEPCEAKFCGDAVPFCPAVLLGGRSMAAFMLEIVWLEYTVSSSLSTSSRLIWLRLVTSPS